MWPSYSKVCRSAVDALLKKGGSLSAYRANPKFPSWTGPTEGSYAYRLEREIETRFNVKHAIVVNSGTAALHASLVGAGIGPGDEVVVPPYTFSATAAAPLLVGATLRFADVDPYSFCITKETVGRVITRRTKAIIPVHLFGGMADLSGLQSFGVPVIEDACQAVGARNQLGYAGTIGKAGAYSFNGTKNVPAGEAGAIVTNDSKLAERARLFMNHGENFHSTEVGVNYRMNELTACVAYHGLLELEERNKRRQQLAETLSRSIWAWNRFHMPLDTPRWIETDHVFYVYPFTIKSNRERFIKRMAKHGIPVGAGYITPTLPHYKAFRKYQTKALPVVEELSKKTLCILSTLTPDRPLSYASHVADCMRKALE